MVPAGTVFLHTDGQPLPGFYCLKIFDTSALVNKNAIFNLGQSHLALIARAFEGMG